MNNRGAPPNRLPDNTVNNIITVISLTARDSICTCLKDTCVIGHKIISSDFKFGSHDLISRYNFCAGAFSTRVDVSLTQSDSDDSREITW